jgi:exonuclease SbcC
MTPETLYLKGFAGIRAGLKRDEVTLDLPTVAGDAQLVALAGPNGAGKSTLLDNLHPFRFMPSRASSLSPRGFAFYEHLVLPESAKQLIWCHAGRRYRSTLVFRINSKRKVEAYLHEERCGQWVPVTLSDGTVSDGRAETYDACVEALLGNPETFFTSVFAAQNRRQLCAYTAGEMKALMVELLGLERIRQAGEKAAQVARALKVTQEEQRRVLHSFDDVPTAIRIASESLACCERALEAAMAAKAAAEAELQTCRERAARVRAQRDAGAEVERRRGVLHARLNEARGSESRALASLSEVCAREKRRVQQAERQWAEAVHDAEKQMVVLARRRDEAQIVLVRRPSIEAAIACLPGLAAQESQLGAALDEAEATEVEAEAHAKALAVAHAQLDALRKQAGDAALRAEDLKRRFSLTEIVPCRGTELQPHCRLLSDAHRADALMPSAERELTQIRESVTTMITKIRELHGAMSALGDPVTTCKTAQAALELVRQERREAETVAAMAEHLAQAEGHLSEFAAEENAVRSTLERAKQRHQAEVEEAERAIATIQSQMAEVVSRTAQTVEAIETELAGLPPAVNAETLTACDSALLTGKQQLEATDRAVVMTMQEQATLRQALESARTRAHETNAARARVQRIESEVGWWNLLAKALGPDGVIALCIDDAGPELSRLTNALLLACYGLRFTVSIRTQVETIKRELREGFDVIVFDAETGQSRSVAVMSGGERIWINECLTRAIALYLANGTGRRYDTLFCDEADGALDPERKRMFMQMTREVLRLGGYSREIFVSQTPELSAMADVVIRLDELVLRVEGKAEELAIN